MTERDEFESLSARWLEASIRRKYSYGFTWLGRPVIQYPQDLVALQELVWQIRPRLIVETGVAHGGSLVFFASLLELLGGDGLVVGIEVDLRAHNREALEQHPLRRRYRLIDGSSVDEGVAREVRGLALERQPVLVVLDSNHTHEHVLRELELYSPLVKRGSYLVVLDTVVEDLPDDVYPDRPWARGNNPKTAVYAFLAGCDRFEIDSAIDDRLALSVAPSGYLRCIRDPTGADPT